VGLGVPRSASNYGWIRGVWVSRPGAVTPRLARAPAETPGGPLEWDSWGYNAARARCSETAPS
jgi:hypothetical protein